MILQIPIHIKIKGIKLELESLSREVSNSFGEYGEMSAEYIAKDPEGLKHEFSISFTTSEQFMKLIQQAKGEVIYE